MTKPSRIHGCYITTLVCLACCGCVTWTAPGVAPLSTSSEPTPPSQKFSPSVRGPGATAPGTPAKDSNAKPAARDIPSLPRTAVDDTVIRGQQPDSSSQFYSDRDDDRQPMPVSGVGNTQRRPAAPLEDGSQVVPAQFGSYYDQSSPGASPYAAPPDYTPRSAQDPGYGPAPNAPPAYAPPGYAPPAYAPPGGAQPPIGYAVPGNVTPEFQPGPTDMPGQQPYTGRLADLIVNVREQQTGRFMFGVGVNSDAGLTGQIVIDEYNFDWKRFPRSVDDIMNGTAWRGAGQRFRIEAIPGNQLQRYLVNFTEPYLFDTNISLNLSGFLYDRNYFDWDERRVGGRIGLGYRLTPDLSLTAGMRLESVNINDPRVRGVPELEEVLGDSSLYSGRLSLTQDTRDSPFAATEGYYLELGFEQVFGTFEYPRGNADFRKYFLLNERPDGSGRHVLGTSLQVGLSGSDTPLYENFFAGGYSTLRGFRFRSAAPKSGDVYVGGEFSFLGSVEYMFPVTADDMLKGVVFCDYGTIEEKIEFEKDDFRVAFGAGLRIAIPAMGPAPIALDFAVPVTREETDRIQNFSFFVGFGR